MENPQPEVVVPAVSQPNAEVKNSDEIRGLTRKDVETIIQVIDALCQRTRLSRQELKPLGELSEKLELLLR